MRLDPVDMIVLQVHHYENQPVVDKRLRVTEEGRNVDADPLFIASRAAGKQQQLSILTNQVHQVKLGVAQVKLELMTAIMLSYKLQ